MSNFWDNDEVVQSPPSSTGNFWENDTVVMPPPSLGKDIGTGAVAGLEQGATQLPGTFGSMSQLLDTGISYGVMKGAEKLGLLPKGLTAEDAFRAGQKLGANTPTGIRHGDLSMPTPEESQTAIESVTGQPQQPRTDAGQAAKNIASFLPAAAIGNPSSAARRMVAYGLIPGATSEAAGPLAGGLFGPQAEPYGRAAGAVAGMIGGHTLAGPGPSAPQKILSSATRGITDPEIQAAQAIADRARSQGIQLTGSEALAQATGGKGSLPDVQRVLEGADRSAPLMQDFFANRPQQVETAGRNFFDRLSPASTQPSAVGAQGQQAAQGNLAAIQNHINAVTKPYYDAAKNHVINSSDFTPINSDPAFQASLARLRNDPVLGPIYKGMPDNSVGVIDAVTKDMRAQGQSLGNAVNPGFQPQKAGMFGSGAGSARDIARDPARGGSADYDAALLMQADARRRLLEPQQAGPVGKIAETSDVAAQGNALYPPNPQPGAQGETANAVRALDYMQPGLPAQITRQHLERAFNEAMQQNIPGANQWGGAKFAATAMGNPQQEANIQAGLGALPGSPNIDPLIEALRATGQRHAPGSRTSFNTQMLQGALTGGSPIGALAAAAATPREWFGGIQDAYLKYRLGSNTEALAKALTDPDSLQQILKARDVTPNSLGTALATRIAVMPPNLPAVVQALRKPKQPGE